MNVVHTLPQEVLAEIKTTVDGVVDAIVYPSVTDKTKNRGFAFVEFESHRSAAIARRKLIPGHVLLWGQPIAVDWAEPEHEVDEDIMSKVRLVRIDFTIAVHCIPRIIYWYTTVHWLSSSKHETHFLILNRECRASDHGKANVQDVVKSVSMSELSSKV